jgi:hypothetical protein
MATRIARFDPTSHVGSGLHRRTTDPVVTARLPRVRLEELLEAQHQLTAEAKTTPPPSFSAFPDDEPATVHRSMPSFPAVGELDDLPPPSAELAEVLTTPPPDEEVAPRPPPPVDRVRYVVAAIWALTLTVFGGLAYAVIANG